MYLYRSEEECCVVKFKERWYRAYCAEKCFDGFITTHFIDYGNMALVEVNDIRPIPESLLFGLLNITADCFSDYGKIHLFVIICILRSIFMFIIHLEMDKIETEKLGKLISDLKGEYALKSKWKIERMEERKENDEMHLCAWLQKSN